jgi:hypothetical protein
MSAHPPIPPGQLTRLFSLMDEVPWSFLYDKKRMLWIAAEDYEDGEHFEEQDLGVLLEKVEAVERTLSSGLPEKDPIQPST